MAPLYKVVHFTGWGAGEPGGPLLLVCFPGIVDCDSDLVNHLLDSRTDLVEEVPRKPRSGRELIP